MDPRILRSPSEAVEVSQLFDSTDAFLLKVYAFSYGFISFA